jgi:hypothetical protein
MEEKEEKETPIKVENNDAPVSTMTSAKSTCRASSRQGELELSATIDLQGFAKQSKCCACRRLS